MKWQYFGVMKIEPGDTLFVRTPEPPSQAEADYLQSKLAPGVTVIFVAPDVDIAKRSAAGVSDSSDPLWQDFVSFFDRMEKIQ